VKDTDRAYGHKTVENEFYSLLEKLPICTLNPINAVF